MTDQVLMLHDIFPTTRWFAFRWQIGRNDQGRLYFKIDKRNCSCLGHNHRKCKRVP